jgi:hypothetical protein
VPAGDLLYRAGRLSVCLAWFAQGDVNVKQYLSMDETVTKLRGTTLLPRLKVRPAAWRPVNHSTEYRRSPRASGWADLLDVRVGNFTDGHVDNLGEIKRSGSSLLTPNRKSPLLYKLSHYPCRPHFLMKVPSKMVVMENLPPQKSGAQFKRPTFAASVTQAITRDVRVPEIADRDYREMPVSLPVRVNRSSCRRIIRRA